jgi:hypothetical protein
LAVLRQSAEHALDGEVLAPIDEIVAPGVNSTPPTRATGAIPLR